VVVRDEKNKRKPIGSGIKNGSAEKRPIGSGIKNGSAEKRKSSHDDGVVVAHVSKRMKHGGSEKLTVGQHAPQHDVKLGKRGSSHHTMYRSNGRTRIGLASTIDSHHVDLVGRWDGSAMKRL
jgi:hypothetical protein